MGVLSLCVYLFMSLVIGFSYYVDCVCLFVVRVRSLLMDLVRCFVIYLFVSGCPFVLHLFL